MAELANTGKGKPRCCSTFEANSRGQALALLDAVAAFLRAEEPSSPVPWLIERARALAERDFLTILRAVLPPGALHEPESEEQ